VRLHASSGTTGKPIVVAYTQSDLDVWTQVMVRSFAACGLHRGDVIQNAYGYGLFTGGLGAHYGGEALGATVIPISGGNTDRQIMVAEGLRGHRHLLHAQLLPPPHGARQGARRRLLAPARGHLPRPATSRSHETAWSSRCVMFRRWAGRCCSRHEPAAAPAGGYLLRAAASFYELAG